jgi:hypothetical protein
MFSQEEFGELLVLALEKAYDDLISLPLLIPFVIPVIIVS